MKYIAFILLCLSGVGYVQSQSHGDTIIIKSLHHASATRDTMVNFPDDPSLSFSKILMKYNMRCKDGLVSTGQNRNRGCGEWDYSCNTYIHDSTKVDSLLSKQTSHVITQFTGSSFSYTSIPIYNYYLNYQTNVSIDSIINESQSTVGTGNIALKDVLPTNNLNGKTQFVFTSNELFAAGVTTGLINGIGINVLASGSNPDFLRVRIKPISDSILTGSDPQLIGFTEVYFKNTVLSTGLNRLQFHTPFSWNGTDNLLFEFSFTNNQSTTAIDVAGHLLTQNRSLHTSGDKFLNFNGLNYIEAIQYKGIEGNNPRTIEAWIKTVTGGKEIVSWGRDAASEKWNFLIEQNGKLRVEVNGGYLFGTTDLRDNEWHHITCTFSGNNVNQVKLYVDGVLETIGGQGARAVTTNITNGINLRITRGTNNRYFIGVIDEVRVWDTSLTALEIQEWMRQSLHAGHPKFSHLQASYSINETSGISIIDSTSFNRNANVVNGGFRSVISGIDLFKEFSAKNTRPNITFYQGTYNLTLTVDTIVDSVLQLPHAVTAYQIHPKTGTIYSDSISSTLNYFWQAGYSYTIDTNGIAIDSAQVVSQGNITIQSLEYYRRFPMKYEILSFVTPYGIGVDFGMEGKTWTFDLTDFSPVLKGNKRLTMEWGGQWQEEMDIQFEFIVGIPPRDIVDIEQIWRVTKPSYTSIANNDAFEPRNFQLNSLGKSFMIKSAITGHGQEGEFIPRNHIIDVNNSSLRETWQVWKTCGENPVHPQGGTWIYDRAGWCPGMATDIREIDITSKVNAGNSTRIEYGVQSASGATEYIVNNQLVTYGNPNFNLDASISEIKSPTTAIEYGKTNYICANPTIVIQNTGTTAITSLDIYYWINDSQEKEIFNWTGNLGFLEKEDVILPTGGKTIWKAMKPSGNKFYARVDKPNAGADQYEFNNSMRSEFEIPDVLPRNFVMWFRTNNAANENKLFIHDEYGNEVFRRVSFQNNTDYKDTLSLGHGCYTLFLEDTDGDGIDFWANNDGSGFFRITTTDSPFGSTILNLEPDFGSFIQLNFTIDNPLSFEEFQLIKNGGIKVYPNPASDKLFVEFSDYKNQQVVIYNSAGQEISLIPTINSNKLVFDVQNLNKGIYLISVLSEGKIESRKVIIR